MAQSRSRHRTKPSKPSRSFPLTAHNNGQWCKKILGKVHFFGVWEDPQAALANYREVAADLHAGRQPRPSTLAPGGVTVKDVCEHYLTYQLHKVNAGEIGARWFEDCRRVTECFAKFVGASRNILDLAALDFERFREKLSKNGLTAKGSGLGVCALDRAITVVKGALKYAYEMDLIEHPIKVGKAFNKPSATLKRKSRLATEQKNGKKLFSAPQIREMLEKAEGPLRTMILLAINGGLGNADCARLPISVIDWDQGLIDYPRFKTGVARVVPLWPETQKALKESIAARPQAADKETAKLVFVTRFGRAWMGEKVHRRADGGIEKVVPIDAVGQEFDKLLNKLGCKRKGVGFYCFRHCFRTWADEVRDPHAVARVMGHALPGMASVYVEEISVDRLRAVADHVRSKILA